MLHTLAGRPYTFTAKRYTFTYTRMRMELDHEKLDVYRGRFLQIAGGSARECGAIPDMFDRCGVLDREAVRKGKDLLVRIVAMLTRMIERGNQVREDDIMYGYVNGNGNEGHSGQQSGGGDGIPPPHR